MYKLYIKQKVFKITDHYDIYDSEQNPVYKVDQDFTFIGNTVRVKKYDADIGFVVDRRIFTFLPQYEVNFSDGKWYRIKQKWTFFRKELEIVSDFYQLRLVGNFWDLDFDVFNGNEKVGEINREWLTWGDTFSITVYNPEFEDELVSLFIAIDNIQDSERN